MPPTYANGHISATGDPIHFIFGSRVGFSGTADRTALFTIRTNPIWRPPQCWKNFKWRYLRNRLSDPRHVLFYVGVFVDGGSNGAISSSNRSKMAAAAILEKFQMAISPQSATGRPIHFMFGYSVGFSGTADGAIFDSNKFKMAPPSWIISNGHISATPHDLLI